ncbi:AP-4 complex subunit sigma-1-like [Homarus americanus]|uniref:AP-4 complex subunit sigma-1-like n=1 Tax=Homarus americanus TaxID=6706 RepID=UPI001C448A8E|nr:AP-4 complex subunit sigma-1-like [Homarus americanus]XP_042216605.1 AP-4 complex subunit sigma-1-like [Homarus americanus]
MVMHYLLIASKDGNVQFSHYFTHITSGSRTTTEARAIAKCLGAEKDAALCHFLGDGDHTLVFRWFGPCLFIVAADHAENELMVYEFINLYVNALHRYFGKFSERHVLFNIDRLHMVLEEMVVGGELVESSIRNALSPIQMLDTVSSR